MSQWFQIALFVSCVPVHSAISLLTFSKFTFVVFLFRLGVISFNPSYVIACVIGVNFTPWRSNLAGMSRVILSSASLSAPCFAS